MALSNTNKASPDFRRVSQALSLAADEGEEKAASADMSMLTEGKAMEAMEVADGEWQEQAQRDPDTLDASALDQLGRIACRLEGQVSQLISDYVNKACDQLSAAASADAQAVLPEAAEGKASASSHADGREAASGSPNDGDDADRDNGGRGAARAVKEIGRMTAARAQQLLQTQEEQTREIFKLQRMNKKLKGALKEASAENIKITADLRALLREQAQRDEQEETMAVMMKNTLEQLEKSHKEIVGDRDLLCADLKRELREMKAQMRSADDGAVDAARRLDAKTEQEMNSCKSEIQTLMESLRTCEADMEAMRAKETESNTLLEQRAAEHARSVATLQAARDKDLATIELCEAEIQRLRLALQQTSDHGHWSGLSVDEQPSLAAGTGFSAKNSAALCLPPLMGARTKSSYTPRSWVTEATPRSIDAWTSSGCESSPECSPKPFQDLLPWAGSHSPLQMQRSVEPANSELLHVAGRRPQDLSRSLPLPGDAGDISEQIRRESLLGKAILQQNDDFSARVERVTQLSCSFSVLEEELAHERRLHEAAAKQSQLRDTANNRVNTSFSLLASPQGQKPSAQNSTLSQSGSPASPLPEQSRQALLMLHSARVHQLELELQAEGRLTQAQAQAQAASTQHAAGLQELCAAPVAASSLDAAGDEQVVQDDAHDLLRLALHQLEREKERLEREAVSRELERAECEKAREEAAAALAAATHRIQELERQLQMQHDDAKHKLQVLEMCASSSTTAATNVSVELAESMVREATAAGVTASAQAKAAAAAEAALEADTRAEASAFDAAAAGLALAAKSQEIARLTSTLAAVEHELEEARSSSRSSSNVLDADDAQSFALRGEQLAEALTTIDTLSRKIHTLEAEHQRAEQRARLQERELEDAPQMTSLPGSFNRSIHDPQEDAARDTPKHHSQGQDEATSRDGQQTERDAGEDGEDGKDGEDSTTLEDSGHGQGEEKQQMLKEISALRNRECVLRSVLCCARIERLWAPTHTTNKKRGMSYWLYTGDPQPSSLWCQHVVPAICHLKPLNPPFNLDSTPYTIHSNPQTLNSNRLRLQEAETSLQQSVQKATHTSLLQGGSNGLESMEGPRSPAFQSPLAAVEGEGVCRQCCDKCVSFKLQGWHARQSCPLF